MAAASSQLFDVVHGAEEDASAELDDSDYMTELVRKLEVFRKGLVKERARREALESRQMMLNQKLKAMEAMLREKERTNVRLFKESEALRSRLQSHGEVRA